jgi:hypothetical protein
MNTFFFSNQELHSLINSVTFRIGDPANTLWAIRDPHTGLDMDGVRINGPRAIYYNNKRIKAHLFNAR